MEEDKQVIIDKDKIKHNKNNLKKLNMDILLKIFTDMGYQPVLSSRDEILNIQTENDEHSIYLRTKFLENNEVLFDIDYEKDGIIVLLNIDDYYFSFSPLTYIVKKPYKILKYKNEKECIICNESKTRFFRCCCRCNKSFCNSCFNKSNTLPCRFSCPFCRYSLRTVIEEQAEEDKILLKFNIFKEI